MILLLLLLLVGGRCDDDPSPILYPGQVNIGLLADIHGGAGGGGCGPLRPRAVQRAMAAVWAAHKANFDDPHALNIGVYIYDTCGSKEVATRQAYRLMSHVTNQCPDKKTAPPPLIAVVSDSSAVGVPLFQLFSAFSVPVISATGTPQDIGTQLSTAPSPSALARGAVSVLHELGLLQVAVVAGEGAVFAHFSAQVAHVTGMQATHVQEESGSDDTEEDTLRLISMLDGKNGVEAVVFLVSPDEAVSLLEMVNSSSPLIPWLVITQEDISTRITAEQGKRLKKVLLLSPESPESSPEFHDYLRDVLQEEETLKYHPLLVEYSKETNITDSDVSSVCRAVWSVSSALSGVRDRFCSTAECLLPRVSAHLRRGFDREGALSSLRHALKGFTEQGDSAQLGFYSDDEGLNVEPEMLRPFEVPPTILPPVVEEDLRWQILDDTTLQEDVLQEEPPHMGDLLAKGEEEELQSLTKEDGLSNMRSISLTSHQQTEDTHAYTEVVPLGSWLSRPWSVAVLGTSVVLSLSSLYALVYLLVSGCEGRESKSGAAAEGCWLPVMHLAGLVWLCACAVLHTWKPAPSVCGLTRIMHNTGIVFCYGALLVKGMCLRSRSVVGLGGRVDRCGQLLLLLLVLGVQAGVEVQWWLLRPPSPPPLLLTRHAQLECAVGKREALASHLYPAVLILLTIAVALSTKRLPYSRVESRSLLFTSCACALVLACWCVSCWLLPSLLVAAPSFLLATALTVLVGLYFLPLLVHKGQLLPASSSAYSYTDSLSTVFTMFNNNEDTLTSRGRKKAKTLDYQEP